MAERWIKRHGTPKRGFRYRTPNGRALTDKRALERIRTLRVPPAWREVHIAEAPGHVIQAWGYDARGRKQYRYHTKAVVARDLRKYHRVRDLAKRLPRIRETLRRQSATRALTRDAACAIALRLISETLFRPGSDRYERENGSHGLTTLKKRHLRLEPGRAVVAYRGKSGKRQRQLIADTELLPLISRVNATPGARLLRFREDGRWRDLTAPMLIDFMRRRIGPFAVKDFRTWGATLRAATLLAELGPARSDTEARRNVALAMRVVASELGNTPAICRSSYVHPIILARYVDDGDTISVRGARPSGRIAHSPEERALIAFLDRHFRDRRRRPRHATHVEPVMARAA